MFISVARKVMFPLLRCRWCRLDVLVIAKESYACLVYAWKRGRYRVPMKPKTYEKKEIKWAIIQA